MKTAKGIISVILAVVFLAAGFSGCDGGGHRNNDPPTDKLVVYLPPTRGWPT